MQTTIFIISIVVILFIAVISILITKTDTSKGEFAELKVKELADKLLNANEYRAIHNVTVKTLDGTTQIDHIFVSKFGVFVVETKNYNGWIFGNENQATWTQKIFKSTKKFQNPLRQNYKHIKALEALTNIAFDKFHSIIVFMDSVEFKTEMSPNITYIHEYIKYIQSINTQILSTVEIDEVYTTISNGCLRPSLSTNKEHVNNVKRRLDNDAPRACPKCGAEMIKRTTKSGENAGQQFWGCSTFPKCRIMQKIAG